MGKVYCDFVFSHYAICTTTFLGFFDCVSGTDMHFVFLLVQSASDDLYIVFEIS